MPEVDLRLLRARIGEGLDIVVGRWAIWIAAAIFGGAVAVASYQAFRHAPATYPEFVIGYGTLFGFSKIRDYAMLLGFMVGAAGFFLAVARLFAKLAAFEGPAAIEAVYTRFIVAVIPALLWLASLVYTQASTIQLFWVSVAFVIVTTIGLQLALARPSTWFTPGSTANERAPFIFDSIVLVPMAAILVVFAVGLFGNRIGPLNGVLWFYKMDNLHGAALAAGIVGILGVAVLALRTKDARAFARYSRRLLIGLQALLPALFLAVLPFPIVQGNSHVYATPIPIAAWVLAALFALVTWGDLVRLWRRGEKGDESPERAISVMSLIAIVIYCRIPNVPSLGTPFDDYHAGEDFIPWWSWVKYGMIPLWDFTPPRGIINYKVGALAALFTDPSASGMIATTTYRFALLVLLVFPAVALIIGKWRAFLVFALVALDDRIGDIDALMTAGLCILAYAWLKCSRVEWLVTWVIVGTVEVLIAPGQGGILVMATAPGGLWQLYHAAREERPQLLKASVIGLVVLGILAFTTPLGLMIAGAVRYGAGQSAVNGIANGLAWSDAFATVPNASPWLIEILQYSWIGVGVVAAVLTVWAWARSPQALPGHEAVNRTLAIFLGSTVTLLCAIYIIRAAVRLGSQSIGRPGWASMWALAFLLPLLLMVVLRGRARLSALILGLAPAAAIAGQFGVVDLNWASMRPFVIQPPAHKGPNAVDGPSIGIPKLGVVSMEMHDVLRLVSVKRQLDRLLTPTETYLDMTNRGAHYFYFDRQPPSDVSAFYNMITPAQQMRALRGAIQKDVAVALIGADNERLDDLHASLRAHLVYRYLLANFAPITLDGYDYMIRPDRLAKLGLQAAQGDEALQILDRNFLKADLNKTAVTLGESIDSLSARMSTVVDLNKPDVRSADDIEITAEGAYRVVGPKPAITFDLRNADISGMDAGLLRFRYDCLDKRGKPTMTASWKTVDGADTPQAEITFFVRDGAVIVPLDSAPRWLLASRLESLRLTISDRTECRLFTLDDVALAQRAEVGEMEKILQGGQP